MDQVRKSMLHAWCMAGALCRRHLVLYLRTMLVMLLLVACIMAVGWFYGGTGRWVGGVTQLQEVFDSVGEASVFVVCVAMLRWLLEVYHGDNTALSFWQVWPLLGHHVVRYLVYVCYMMGFFALFHLLMMEMHLLVHAWQSLDVYYLVMSAVILCAFVGCTYVAVFLPFSVFFIMYRQPGLRAMHAKLRNALRGRGSRGVMLCMRLGFGMVYQLMMGLPVRACESALCLVWGRWWRTGVTLLLPSVLLVVVCQCLAFVLGLYHAVFYAVLVLPIIKYFLYGVCAAYLVALYHVVYSDLC